MPKQPQAFSPVTVPQASNRSISVVMGNPGLVRGLDLEVAGHNEILYTNSAMNKLFFILIESIFLSYLPLGNQSVSQKVYLKFGRGFAKFSEKFHTVQKEFVILKFGHKHFIHFYFSDRPLSQSFIRILLWKLQSVPKLLGH